MLQKWPPRCSLEGLSCELILLGSQTGKLRPESLWFMQWPPHAPASGPPGAMCLFPPWWAVVGAVLLRPSPEGLDCLSAALFILLLWE